MVATSLAEFDRDEWDELVHASAAPVFYSWDFLRAIEAQPLTEGAVPFYLLDRGADGLAAATVVYSQTSVNPFDPDGTEERMLAGHLWHCYDTRLLTRGPATPGLVDDLAAALDRLAGELGVRWRGLHNLDLTGALATAVGAPGLVASAVRYRLTPAPGHTVERHLEAVGRSSRRTMRKYLRRAEEAGLRAEMAPVDNGLADDVLELCLATADKRAPGYYPPDRLAHLLRALGPSCAILRLELGGRLLACSICLLDHYRAHFWAGGSLYPEELNWSPQYVLFAAELRYGLAIGRPELEFGRRNDEFKRRYGLVPTRLGSWAWGA